MFCLLLASALASPQSADIELQLPRFGAGGMHGIEGARLDAQRTARFGALVHHTAAPLVYREADEQGIYGLGEAAVGQRSTISLGASVAVIDALTVRAMLPVMVQWDDVSSQWGHTGVGLGDPLLGVLGRLYGGEGFAAAVSLDVRVPVGERDAWMGHQGFTGWLSVPLQVDLPRVQVIATPSLVLRPPVDAGDLDVGSALRLDTAAVVSVWPEHLVVSVGLMGRAGLDEEVFAGGDNAVEALLGARVFTGANVAVEAGLGKGVIAGYGSSAWRAWLGVTVQTAPLVHLRQREPKPEPVLAVEVVPTPVETVVYTPPELEIRYDPVAEDDAPWAVDVLARVEQGRIQIKEPIRFEKGTAAILAESLPTLEAVAALMHRYWQLEHLLVVGHASSEGSHDFNFDLSARRARALYQALVGEGVHPDRISYRGMGEVAPEAVEEEEADRALNRRAEFRILRQLHPMDPVPDYPEQFVLPWTGETIDTHPSGDGLLPAVETP